MWRHAGERRDRNVVGAVAAAVVVLLFPGTLAVAAPGAAAPAVSAPDETGRPFEIGARDRREAGKEVARGAKKNRKGDARAALKHYLAALQLDPYNVAAREGLAALVGPIGPCGAPGSRAPAPGSAGAGDVAPEGEVGSGGMPAPSREHAVWGRFPGLPRGPIRTTGASYRQAEPYLRAVQRSAEHYGVEPRLILGVIRVESNFNPRARSASGARGLMQLLPETGRRFGARALEDPAENIDAGTRYLRYLLELFHGDVDRALAGYNAGEMSVVRAGGVPATPGVRDFIRSVRASCGEF